MMAIEKLHGMQATAISLNERFTMLATVSPAREQVRPMQRRNNFGSTLNWNQTNHRNIIGQIAKRLQQQAKRRTINQRLGRGGMLRRYDSETSYAGLRPANSFNNINQRQSVKNRISWRRSSNNMIRSSTFNTIVPGNSRGRNNLFVGVRGVAMRGRLRGGRLQLVRATGRNFGKAAARPQNVRRRVRGRGRGGIQRNQAQPKTVPTKEELDAQLDQYMSSSKLILDNELDAYMKNAGDSE